MKRIVILFAMMCVMAVCVFAQSYTVQSVTGRVQQEKGGSRVELKVGDTITADTVIHTGVGASVVLKTGDKTLNVSAAQSGKVSEVASASSAVRITGSVAKTDTGAVNRTTAQASTASARASEAAQGEDIAAE
ncbi:hypothetical protein R84B8_00767 [Treponema sp. R8-4-B8]